MLYEKMEGQCLEYVFLSVFKNNIENVIEMSVKIY